jgi:hypothetical protein
VRYHFNCRESNEDFCADRTREVHPLFQAGDGGSIPTSALRARHLLFEECTKPHAVALVRLWHSRLPRCARGPWTNAFHAHHNGITYAVALWNNPSTRCLPSHWRELRRMACSPDSPRNTASRFLAWMFRWFQTNNPSAEKLISYQDRQVHTGTIYRAAGWTPEYVSEPRRRDRSIVGPGFRTAMNGSDADVAGKVRWAIMLTQSLKGAR